MMSLLNFVLFFSSISYGHILLINPAPRLANDNLKFIQNNPANPGPDNPNACRVPRTANPHRLVRGSKLVLNWNETINHPGRFIVQFSPAAEQGFWLPANELFNQADLMNRGMTQIEVTLPNITCTDCTLRVLQQMDDQPGEYYVQCVDLVLNDAVVPPPVVTPPGGGAPPDVSAQSVTGADGYAKFGAGCGQVTNQQKPFSWGFYLVLMMPLFIWMRLWRFQFVKK
jgi:hypothetical protein